MISNTTIFSDAGSRNFVLPNTAPHYEPSAFVECARRSRIAAGRGVLTMRATARSRLRAAASADGFTMIELLLVITLSLIVIGGTVGVLIAGMRSEPRIAERTADIQAARVAMERLTREIRQGATVTSATGSTIALITNVNSATCGGAHAAEARPCRVTYACTSGNCTRTESEPGRQRHARRRRR